MAYHPYYFILAKRHFLLYQFEFPVSHPRTPPLSRPTIDDVAVVRFSPLDESPSPTPKLHPPVMFSFQENQVSKS